MEIIGYIAAVLIGLSLGLVGGGGSILTVPILVYFFRVEPGLATTYSLFVVGITSAIGSITHFKHKNIKLSIALLFGLPSLAAVFIMRRFVMPLIPYHILNIGKVEVTKPVMLMVLFSILMILAAISMITGKTKQLTPASAGYQSPHLVLHGLVIGIITGFVGVGGGFLIIPSLVIFAKMPMKKAVGTSLIIISVSSLFGVIGDMLDKIRIDYTFLAVFSAFAIGGIIVGSLLSKNIQETKLKPAFGWFVLLIGIVILVTEFI